MKKLGLLPICLSIRFVIHLSLKLGLGYLSTNKSLGGDYDN